jgi:hypothetical protein
VHPAETYRARLEERLRTVASGERLHIRIGNLRLLTAASALALIWLSSSRAAVPPWSPLAPALVFCGLAVWHARVIRRRDRAARAARHFQQGLDRLAGNWAGEGDSGERFRDEAHVYAEDLDLFGPGSLYARLCTARTPAGQEALAGWLRAPSPLAEVKQRQQAVEELRNRVDLREALALLGEAPSGLHSRALIDWAETPPLLPEGRSWRVAMVLSGCMLASWTIWALLGSAAVFLVVLLPAALFGWRLRERVRRVLSGVDAALHGLDLLAGVLALLEREAFAAPRLAALRERLVSGGEPASRRIALLDRIAEWIDSRDNLLVRVAGPPLLFSTHLAFAVERWRRRSGPEVRRWLEAAGELEALCAIAGYAFEHPEDPFPELAETGPEFSAEGLAHPLLPSSRAVRNDVRLSAAEPLLIVSGSNMSGKSTLLRTVGVNAVLGLAGAPVRARRLRLSFLYPGATMRIHDSLREGESRFSAEIKRLRKLMDLSAAGTPVLFLLDELLHGTNSHDRAIGAEAVVRGLVQHGAIGLITTHDLTLTSIAAAARGRNIHFEDRLENGRMTFDYLARDGVVTKSNALELMRLVGLPVPLSGADGAGGPLARPAEKRP